MITRTPPHSLPPLPTLRKLYFHFLSHWMGYDHGDSFPFDFLNQMEFHLVQNGKENCHHDHIPFNVKGTGNTVFSVYSQKQQWSDVQLSERLASLGIMGTQLRVPLKPPVYHCTMWCTGESSFVSVMPGSVHASCAEALHNERSEWWNAKLRNAPRFQCECNERVF